MLVSFTTSGMGEDEADVVHFDHYLYFSTGNKCFIQSVESAKRLKCVYRVLLPDITGASACGWIIHEVSSVKRWRLATML